MSADKLKQKDELIASLFDLQRRVRAGELPQRRGARARPRLARDGSSPASTCASPSSSASIPTALKNRLIPGFSAELDQLVKRQPTHNLAPSEEPSPLLTLVLDVEQQLFAAADRRRQRAGIKSPIDSGPLSQRLEAPNRPPPPTSLPPRRASAARHRRQDRRRHEGRRPARRRQGALSRRPLHRRAEGVGAGALRRSGDDARARTTCTPTRSSAAAATDEAIKGWEKLAADHADDELRPAGRLRAQDRAGDGRAEGGARATKRRRRREAGPRTEGRREGPEEREATRRARGTDREPHRPHPPHGGPGHARARAELRGVHAHLALAREGVRPAARAGGAGRPRARADAIGA